MTVNGVAEWIPFGSGMGGFGKCLLISIFFLRDFPINLRIAFREAVLKIKNGNWTRKLKIRFRTGIKNAHYGRAKLRAEITRRNFFRQAPQNPISRETKKRLGQQNCHVIDAINNALTQKHCFFFFEKRVAFSRLRYYECSRILARHERPCGMCVHYRYMFGRFIFLWIIKKSYFKENA